MTHRDLLAVCDLELATAKRLAMCEPFICENEDLNEFFANDAVFYSKHLLGKTYLIGRLATNKTFAGKGIGTAVMDFIKERIRYGSQTGCRFIIVDAFNSEPTIHYYLKNKFQFLVEDERLEAKYMGIGVGRLPLNTRLMYYDLMHMSMSSGYDEE